MHMKNPNAPRTLTEAQIAANRENAKKSTGPRTAEGKAASSRNRLLHGLRANKHILLDNDQPEDFLLLLKSLDAAFRPVGEGEEMLVTQIAADQWRLDRALPMEAGIYRRRLEGVAADDYCRKRELINEKRNHERDPENYSPASAPPHPKVRLAPPPAEPDPPAAEPTAEKVVPVGQAAPPVDATSPQNSTNYH